MRSICWTDHANWTRLEQKPEVDVKCVRWLTEITSDGSVIRSLAGRSAKFADGTSRNCRDRDALIAQRTADLQGLVEDVRNFDLDMFAAEYENLEENRPVAWTLPKDAE